MAHCNQLSEIYQHLNFVTFFIDGSDCALDPLIVASNDQNRTVTLLFLDVLRPRQDCLYVFLSKFSDVSVVFIGVDLERVLVKHCAHGEDLVVESAGEDFLGNDAHLDTLSDPLEGLG